MEFYEEDVRKYPLGEFLSSYSINPLLGTLLWCLMKIYLIRPQNNPFPVCRSLRENLVELNEIPERFQSEVSAELKILAEAGFIEPQLIKLLSGSRQSELKLSGITILALHAEKLMGVKVMIFFPDEEASVRMPYSLLSFPDSVSSLTTSNQKNLVDFDAGDSASSHPDATLVELIQIHQQRLAESNRSCLTIDHGDELLQLIEARDNRRLDYDISRGWLKRVYPS